MVDSLANLQMSSVDQHPLHVKNEIMFCDIIAVQVALPSTTLLSICFSQKSNQDLSEPTKLMITYNSVSTFITPPNQSKGYFFKNHIFPSKHAASHRVYEFR
jgi:hypothetical protein